VISANSTGSAINSANQLVATWHTSQTKTLADAMRRETIIGTTGAAPSACNWRISPTT
jgi:hypothetical protein